MSGKPKVQRKAHYLDEKFEYVFFILIPATYMEQWGIKMEWINQTGRYMDETDTDSRSLTIVILSHNHNRLVQLFLIIIIIVVVVTATLGNKSRSKCHLMSLMVFCIIIFFVKLLF